MTVKQLASGLWQIDLPFLGQQEIIGSYLLAGSGEVALMDPGPSTTIEPLLDGIREAGFAPENVTHLLATHIHLDHAGSVGSLTKRLPNAKVYAHHKGAPHLLDTSKVVASATRIYGDRMQMLWGEIEPVPQDRLQVLSDRDELMVAGQRIEIYYAPGHAQHHVLFLNTATGDLFAGDVAGVQLPGVSYVRPPTPPPDLDLEAWISSLKLVQELNPETLYMAHFGATGPIEEHCAQLEQRLIHWGELVLEAMRQGKEEAEIIPLFIEQTNPELQKVARHQEDAERYDIATNYPMTVQGYIRYWRKQHPERL